MKSCHYNLYLFDREEPRELSCIQGEKLTMVLISQNIPKFILIDDDPINTASIKELCKVEDHRTEQVYLPTVGMRNRDLGSIEIELTEEEKLVHSAYLALKGKLNNKFLLK